MADGAASVSIGRVSAGNGPDPLIGRLINDRFKIISVIARGGMGKVYRAEQAPLGRTCALKVLNPKYGGDHDPEFHKRFFLEASIASKLTHPNTVTIFDYGRSDDDIYYMAMEYLEGQTLYRAIRDDGAFPEERAAHVARQICRSLREAHSFSVIHRDLKPANIFLVEHADERDFVKVLDFGLVKNVGENQGEDLTQAGLFMGSPKYMAPEQIKGDKVDARTDIYSLGVILYEMIAGKVPFDRPNSVHIMMAHVNEDPAPLKVTNPKAMVSPATEEVVMRCLEKDPDRRYGSMEQLLNALKVVGAVTGSGITGSMSGGVIGSGEFLAVTGSGPGTAAASNLALTGSGPQQPMFLSPSTGQNGPIPQEFSASSGPNPLLAAQEPSANTNRNLLIGAIAAMIVLILLGIVMILRRDSSNAPNPTVSAVSAAPEKTATIHFDTTPTGAMVEWAGKKVCEATPCDVSFKGDDAAPEKEHRFMISKDGFQPEVKAVRVSDKTASVSLLPAGARPGNP